MPTIGGTALLNANRVGEREAIVTAERRWTWRELETDIANAAAALAAFGLRERDRIAILAANSPEFIIACLISRLPRYGSTAPLASPVKPTWSRPQVAQQSPSHSSHLARRHAIPICSPAATAMRYMKIAPSSKTTRSFCTPPGPPENPRVCCWITTVQCGRRWRRSSRWACVTAIATCTWRRCITRVE